MVQDNMPRKLTKQQKENIKEYHRVQKIKKDLGWTDHRFDKLRKYTQSLEPSQQDKKEELDVPMGQEEIEPQIQPEEIKKTKTSNLDDDLEVILTSTEKEDLTDTGETALHSHAASAPLAHKASHQNGGADEIDVTGLTGIISDHGGLSGLADNDHPQYPLAKKAFTASQAITQYAAISLLDNGKIIESVADTTAPDTVYLKFIGFAPSAISKDASGDVQLLGVFSGLSGLSIGSIYYLKNNASFVGAETQTQETKDSTVDNGTYWQEYTPTKPFLISVIFWLENLIGTGADITLTIKEGNTTLATKLITVPDEAGQEYVWTFANPVLTSPGVTHKLQVTLPDNMKWHYNTAGGYADGFFRKDDSATDLGDVYFKLTEADGDGQINTSVGDNTKKVGIAVSATELNIINII